jgi:hypothetical protein
MLPQSSGPRQRGQLIGSAAESTPAANQSENPQRTARVDMIAILYD